MFTGNLLKYNSNFEVYVLSAAKIAIESRLHVQSENTISIFGKAVRRVG